MSDDKHDEIHRYEYSGIEERVGKLPRWLSVVYLVLAIWAIYYLWTYWNHP